MEKDKDLYSSSSSEKEDTIFRNVNGNPHTPIDTKTGKVLLGESGHDKTVAAIRKYSSDPARDLDYSDLPTDKRSKSNADCIVKVNLDSDIQKQFDNVTPKERSKLAFRYIMDNLRGKYPTNDEREVLIERVGAKEIAHTLFIPKIRVIPELGRLICSGEFMETKNAEHGPFIKFAYYKVHIAIADDIYSAVLNIGIRDNGDSTLYDINQFIKQ